MSATWTLEVRENWDYHQCKMIVRSLYIVFLGVLVALFAGVGIATFYKSPKLPEPLQNPPTYFGTTPSASESSQLYKMQQENNLINQKYQDDLKTYNHDISEIALAISVILLLVGIIALKNITILSDGVVLGAVLTLCYSIIRGMMSQDEVIRFFVVTIGLIFALSLGYIKFLKPAPTAETPKKRRR